MKSSISNDLWPRVDLALNQARTRAETVSELNRLLGKWKTGAPANYISEAGSELRQEWLTAADLSNFTRGHSRINPRRLGGPLVAAEYAGKTYMLDGTNRINAWLQAGNKERHEVIIISRQANDA